MAISLIVAGAFSAPTCSSNFLKDVETKKREELFVVDCFYGRFLSSRSARIRPMTIIANIIPIDSGRKY